MTNYIAKAVHCPTCGSPPRRACKALNPAKDRIVPTHSARKRLFIERYFPILLEGHILILQDKVPTTRARK